jgi:Na+/pantothenate symporter
MNDVVQKVLGITLVVVLISIMIENSTGTNSIIKQLAESYGEVVKSLKA